MAQDEWVKGLQDLMAELKHLSPNIEKNVLRAVMSKAAGFMAEKVKAEAPVSSGTPPKGAKVRAKYPPGTLKASIKSRRARIRQGEVSAGIGGAYYSKWVEFGHVLKSHGKSKASRKVIGHVPPNPFIARAFEANKDAVMEVIREALAKEIEKRVKRLQKKHSGG